MIEKVCAELPKEEAIGVLCDQIVATSGLQGKQAAKLLSERLS